MNWLNRFFGEDKEDQISIETASYSDKGNRPVQEDSFKVTEKNNSLCCVLCDGLGGHGMGDVASSIASLTITDQFLKNDDDLTNLLGQAFKAAQDKIMQEQKRLHAQERMKTTAVALVTDKQKAYIGYIGDSRIYIFYKNGKMKRSLDHSVPQMLAVTHEIRENEIRNHPQRNKLIRVMGVEWEKPMYELMIPVKLSECAAFLLCSDGFWELIDEKEMKETLNNSSTVEEWLEAMIRIVKINGYGKKMDNNSAIAMICK